MSIDVLLEYCYQILLQHACQSLLHVLELCGYVGQTLQV